MKKLLIAVLVGMMMTGSFAMGAEDDKEQGQEQPEKQRCYGDCDGVEVKSLIGDLEEGD